MFYNTLILLILSQLEIVLGIDNLIFISLLVQKVPIALQNKTCLLALSLALLMRIAALFFISSILNMDKAIFSFLYLDISIKDCVMVIGGVFLSIKSLLELYDDIFTKNTDRGVSNINPKSRIILIVLTDLVFSIDSILTAIALTDNIVIIIIAFILSMLAMFFISSHTISLVNSYPELKVLGILFIFTVGIYLIFDGLHIEISQKYMYFAFAFSILTTFFNIIKRKNTIKKRKERHKVNGYF